MKPTLYFFTNIVPLYRKKLYETLFLSPYFDCHFFFGKNDSAGIAYVDFEQYPFKAHKNRLNPLYNVWVRGKYLVWQYGVIRRCLFEKPDLVILLGDFLVVSNWLAAAICRIRGIKVVFRGHGMYGNEKGLKLFLRTRYYKLANINLVYERRSKGIMVANGFDPSRIHVFFNSLDYDIHKQLRTKLKSDTKETVFPFFENPNLPTLIFVGRLTKVKKLDFLIHAAARLKAKNIAVNLLLIGAGEEEQDLKQLADKILDEKRYFFYGSCYDEAILFRLISSADLCVSPGNIGLTAIHCLSFGTPVCTHSNWENQMPEVEALEEGVTGVFFEDSNLDDLTAKLEHWLVHGLRDYKTIQTACFKIIDTYYNPYYQEKILKNIVEGNAPLL